jgi:hypothetical protein
LACFTSLALLRKFSVFHTFSSVSPGNPIITELSASILLKNISKIVTPDGTEVSDPAQIKEFVDNANATLINELSDKLTKIRMQGSVKPLQLKATEEQIKKGVPVSYEVPITFDTANFFV